ncbi:MAG: ATP-dependent helicase HrpB [Planctomycetota bacterium]
MDPLPIDAVLPRLVEALGKSSCVVLRAPTGAGKTTRVPPALLDAGLADRRKVLMLEPRRLAARAASRRIAFERGVRLGEEVGFHVRFDRRASDRTRILVVTEGLLLRMLQEDPFLDEVGVVVLDEFHERNLDTDLALALSRKIQLEVRPDLKIVVMSATLDTAEVSRFLGGCPVVESEGRLFPVEVRWIPVDERRPVHEGMVTGVAQALDATEGDVLAFLPGVGEIRRAREALEPLARKRDLLLVELYGDLPMERQDAALSRADRRKVVLATNVAETSVTVEGVTAVVDSGLARVMRFDPSVGLDRLELSRISRASAEQRAGRAGRTAPGVCFRLWSQAEERSLREREDPEIRRVDLAGPVLQLRAFGESDVRAFGWLEHPAEAALARADELLSLLGAVDGGGLTKIGRAMARIPAHPRIARLLLEGEALGCAREAAVAGALLAERDPFRGRNSGLTGRRSDSDVLDRVRAIDGLDAASSAFVLRAAEDLERHVKSGRGRGSETSFLRALLAAFPDRVAKRRAKGDRRGILVGGRGVTLGEESGVVDAELFLCIDIDAGRRGERSEALVRQASAVEREWLPPERIRTETILRFDPVREAVVAARTTRYEDLALEEAVTALPEGGEVARVLAEAAATDLERALPLRDEETRAFLARLRSLRGWVPELGLPAFDEKELREILPELCEGYRSFADLRQLPLIEILKNRLTHEQRRALEREAPEQLSVPSGSSIRLVYEPGQSPVLAVRIQEIFGMADTPTIAGGRVKVLLHLLAPNHRPQQVTDDLRSFWSGAYVGVRQELKRRYPRHSWPEDPWRATPERKPRPRRSRG